MYVEYVMSLLASPNWSEMFQFSVPPLEIVLRGSIMYWFIFILLRFAGRRDMGSLGVADMLVIVLIADAAQNGMAGEYKSVIDGVILVGTIVSWTVIIDRLAYHIPLAAKFLVMEHICLVRDGTFMLRNMRRESITREELLSELRLKGFDSVEQVRRVYIEADGNISVLPKRRAGSQPGIQ